MSDNLEDLIAIECDRQNVRPSADIMREMLIECVGRYQNGFVKFDIGSMSLVDFVSSCRNRQPEAFANRHATEAAQTVTAKKATGMTAKMMAEIKSLRARGLPVR